jgi:hypothetical protein
MSMTLLDALALGIFGFAYLVLARGNVPPLRLDRASSTRASSRATGHLRAQHRRHGTCQGLGTVENRGKGLTPLGV